MVRLDLPWDLVEDILSRVPATSLRELRFTCKRWNALCKDPDFIKKHLDKAAKQNSVLMIRNFRVYSLSVNLNKIHNNIVVDPSIEFISKLRSLNESGQVDINLVFHCNGLLLCSMKESYKTKLVVVNPCTGQTRWIETKYDRYVLGYENKNNNDSYKILRFPYCRFPYDRSQFEIFELKSDSWRVLANISPNEDLWTLGRGMSLKGNAYWMSQRDILSFDFTRERFRRFSFPFPGSFRYKIALSVVKEEQLSLLVLNKNPELEVWVSNKMDTKTVFSWSKCFTLDLSSEIRHRFTHHGSCIVDQEKELVVYCRRSADKRRNVIYIVSKHGYKKINYDKDQSNHHCYPFVFSYFPSLVSLNPPM